MEAQASRFVAIRGPWVREQNEPSRQRMTSSGRSDPPVVELRRWWGPRMTSIMSTGVRRWHQ